MNFKALLRSGFLPILLGGAAGLAGCVERKITIASDPPGALVYVNDVEMGRTPVTFPFTWYGDYDVRLRLDKNEGTEDQPRTSQYYLHTHQKTDAPPYQWLGIDLFAELLPIPFKDEKVWAFSIPKAPQPTDDELVGRAKELRGELAAPDTTFGKGKKASATAPATKPK